MLFPGELDRRAVSQDWDRKRRVVQENRPANTTVLDHSLDPLNSTADSAMKPHTFERSVIEQCPDCGRLFTDQHPDCPEDTNTTDTTESDPDPDPDPDQ